MRRLTDEAAERNIYVHPNPLARDIFWQRLEGVARLIARHSDRAERCLDFGGGSGAFLPALSRLFAEVDVVDLDPADAERISRDQQLSNTRLIADNLLTHVPAAQYDAVVATDVLEHFPVLAPPLAAIRRFLRPGGLLYISIPTENWIYELGRVLVRKTKPADHYHPASRIMAALADDGFALVDQTYAPRYLLPVPLFRLAVWRLPARST